MTYIIDSFQGGEDTSSSFGTLPAGVARRMLGLRCRANRTVAVRFGSSANIVTGLSNIGSFFRYRTESVAKFLYGYFSAGNAILYNQTDGASILTIGGASSYLDAAFRFAQRSNNLYIMDPRGAMRYWRDGIYLGQAQVANPGPPSVPPGTATGGAGLLNSLGTAVGNYQYKYTYVLDSGAETNATNASNGLFVNNQIVNVTVFWDLGYTAQIVRAKIYRRGGNTSDYYYVGTVNNPGYAGGGYVPSSVFADNIPDIDQSITEIAPINNFPPPLQMTNVFEHLSRLVGFNPAGNGGTEHGNVLHFSALGNYAVFGRGEEGFAANGGSVVMDGPDDDSILCGASIGNVAIIGRRYSVWAWVGSSFDDFRFIQRSNIGVFGTDCLVRGYNEVYYVGTDFRVYSLANGEPEWISERIQSSLDAFIDPTSTITAKLVFADGNVYLNVHTSAGAGSSKLFIYDTMMKGWVEDAGLGDTKFVSVDRNFTGSPFRREFMAYVNAGRTGVVSLHSIEDLASVTSSQVIFKTGEFTSPALQMEHHKHISQIDSIRIEGNAVINASSGSRLRLYVEADAYVRTYELVTGAGDQTLNDLIYNARVHPDLVGRYISVRLEGECKKLELSRIVIKTTKVRTAV